MEFSDKDILTDLLIGTKGLSLAYHTAVLEAANDRVRNTLIQINNEELNAQKQIFDLMCARGWYQPEPAYSGAMAGSEVAGMHPESRPAGRTSPSPDMMGNNPEGSHFSSTT